MKEEQVAVATQLNEGLENYDYQTELNKILNENTISINKKTVVLRVYVDENGKKYLGGPELTSMNGMEPSFVYHYADGREISVSPNIMRDKPAGEVPEGYISTETRYPDFSGSYPYNKELGLYEVTDEDIAKIKAAYEAMHPDIEVVIEFQKITTKKAYNTDGRNIDTNSNDTDNSINNNPNKEYEDINGNDMKSELSQMLEEKQENINYPKHII